MPARSTASRRRDRQTTTRPSHGQQQLDAGCRRGHHVPQGSGCKGGRRKPRVATVQRLAGLGVIGLQAVRKQLPEVRELSSHPPGERQRLARGADHQRSSHAMLLRRSGEFGPDVRHDDDPSLKLVVSVGPRSEHQHTDQDHDGGMADAPQWRGRRGVGSPDRGHGQHGERRRAREREDPEESSRNGGERHRVPARRLDGGQCGRGEEQRG